MYTCNFIAVSVKALCHNMVKLVTHACDCMQKKLHRDRARVSGGHDRHYRRDVGLHSIPLLAEREDAEFMTGRGCILERATKLAA